MQEKCLCIVSIYPHRLLKICVLNSQDLIIIIFTAPLRTLLSKIGFLFVYCCFTASVWQWRIQWPLVQLGATPLICAKAPAVLPTIWLCTIIIWPQKVFIYFLKILLFSAMVFHGTHLGKAVLNTPFIPVLLLNLWKNLWLHKSAIISLNWHIFRGWGHFYQFSLGFNVLSYNLQIKFWRRSVVPNTVPATRVCSENVYFVILYHFKRGFEAFYQNIQYNKCIFKIWSNKKLQHVRARSVVDMQYVYNVVNAPVLTDGYDQKNFWNYLLFKDIETVII